MIRSRPVLPVPPPGFQPSASPLRLFTNHGSTQLGAWTLIFSIICALGPSRALAQTPRTTANQGLAAHYGWQDPDGSADGLNSLSLNATDDKTVAAASRVYDKLGDPTINFNLPANDGKYTLTFKLTATTPTLGSGQNSTINAYLTTEYSTNSGTLWTTVGGTSQVTATRNFPGVTTTVQTFTPTLTFSGGQPVWIRLILRGTASGNVGGGQVRVQIYASTGWASDPYAVTWSSGPTVSIPYSANLNGAADGVSYAHSTPAVGSMATTQALTLVYNSTAARPVALVFLDATGPTSPPPTTYQLQVQLASSGAYLTLMNSATSVYYTATPGVVDRLTAAIDAKANGLATGSYPVNLVLTTLYSGNTQTTVVASRILVNDQTASPFGAGVGLAGVGRLYTMTGSDGRLLVDGTGALEYFDRTCPTCAFVSPAGESGTLIAFGTDSFRLTALDGSFADFNTQGFLIRHNLLPTIRDLTFTWTSNLLTGITDASGRGFTLTYSGGFLTQITDFASRTTTTGIASGLLRKVTDPDGGFDSLFYNANNLLTQLNSRSGGVWIYGYNALYQADTVLAPLAADYTGANVRPRTTAVTAAQIQWQPSIAGTSSGAPKGSVRPDTVYFATTDPLGHVTKTQLDRFGQATRVVNALGDTTKIGRDTLGNATWWHEPTGHAMTATYISYFPIAAYDSSTGQTVTYTYGRSTVGQGLAAHYGWFDPSGGNGLNQLVGLFANDSQDVAVGNRLYIKLGDPTAGSNLPALDSNYTVQFKLTASTPTVPAGQNSTVIAKLTTEYSTNSGSSWTSLGTSRDTASLNTPGQLNTVRVFTHTLHFAGGGPVWIRLKLTGIASGTLSGGVVKVQIYASTGWTTDPYPALWLNNTGGAPPRLLGIRGGATRLDYYYHDGTQGPAGTLKQIYLGNTLAPGTVPTDGAVAGWHYPNGYGQDTLVIDGGGHKSRWVYAALGLGANLIQSIDALGRVTTFHYNGYGLADTTTLPNGAKQSARYDLLNRDTIATNGLGYAARFTYGPLGLTRVQDPKNQVYKFVRNPWGLIVAQHDLGDTTKADMAKYDSAGQLRTVITRRADTITVTYDALGRLRTRTGSGPDFPAESLSYGLLPAGGSWVVAANSNGRDSLAYDRAGRLVYAAQKFPGDPTTYTMSYTYDTTGNLISRTAPPNGTTARWVYRKNIAILDTLCGVGTCVAFARDSELKPDTLTFNPGNIHAWYQYPSYDSLHRVTVNSFLTGDGRLPNSWAYDSVGRVKYWNPSNSSPLDYPREVYSYDSASQLINGCQIQTSTSPCNNEYNQAGIFAYKYDSSGTRVDTTVHPVVGAGNRVSQFKGYAITYDANGNVIKKAGLGTVGRWTSTDTTTFQWNAVGQLTRVERWPAGGAHTVVTFRYDAIGRRVGKALNGVTTWFLYDRDRVEMDLDSATHAMKMEYAFTEAGNLFAIRRSTDTVVVIETPTIGTVLGTQRASDGTVVKQFPDWVGSSPLFPWGEEPPDTGFIVRYRMGEQEYDQETGLYHMGARYYDPVLGRWLSEDPAGLAGGINLYSYAGNDPVNASDPSGLRMCSWYGSLEHFPEAGNPYDHYYRYDYYRCSNADDQQEIAFCHELGGVWDSGAGCATYYSSQVPRMGGAGGSPRAQSPLLRIISKIVPTTKAEWRCTGSVLLAEASAAADLTLVYGIAAGVAIRWQATLLRGIAELRQWDGALRAATGIMRSSISARRTAYAALAAAGGKGITVGISIAATEGELSGHRPDWRDVIPGWGTGRAIASAARACNGE